GDVSTITAGRDSILTGGIYSTLTAGDGSELRIRYWDNNADRYRTKIGYVGEDGIKPNTPYKLDDKHEFVEAVVEAAIA
ncbi:MAG: hypothetical protein U7M05_12415, partial [Candidatus Igneacidithiobacillus chanchocoensis]